MNITVKETVEQDRLIAKECDRCKKRYNNDNGFELQEFVTITAYCGYGNKTFGDNSNVEADLCQYCFHELFSPFARISYPSLIL